MTAVTCETQGHLWGAGGFCVMCKTPKPEPLSSNELSTPSNRAQARLDAARLVDDLIVAISIGSQEAAIRARSAVIDAIDL